MDLLRRVARPLLAAPFIVDGFSALRNPVPHVERARVLTPLLEKAGLEVDDDAMTMATRAMGAVTIISGLALATGRGQRGAAAALASVAVPLAVVNSPVWTATSRAERHQMTSDLMRSLALFGGLVIAINDREGKPSAAWQLQNWRTHRAELKDVKSQAWLDAQQVYAA